MLESLTPEVIQIGGRFGPGCVFALHVQRFVHIEPEVLLKQSLNSGSPLRQAAQVDVENIVGRLQITLFQSIVQGSAVLVETSDVAGQEVGAAKVEIVEIGSQDQRGQPIVEFTLPVMVPG